uniref:Uncharacterized protein n=1 Tax=Peronospora matthiolae TaxID=2874970 RepID=A0AAV1TE68_9STRA
MEFLTQLLSAACCADNKLDSSGAVPVNGSGPLTPLPVYELFAVVSHLGKYVVGG